MWWKVNPVEPCLEMRWRHNAQWVRTTKNRDIRSGPLACPFAHWLAHPCLLVLLGKSQDVLVLSQSGHEEVDVVAIELGIRRNDGTIDDGNYKWPFAGGKGNGPLLLSVRRNHRFNTRSSPFSGERSVTQGRG